MRVLAHLCYCLQDLHMLLLEPVEIHRLSPGGAPMRRRWGRCPCGMAYKKMPCSRCAQGCRGGGIPVSVRGRTAGGGRPS